MLLPTVSALVASFDARGAASLAQKWAPVVQCLDGEMTLGPGDVNRYAHFMLHTHAPGTHSVVDAEDTALTVFLVTPCATGVSFVASLTTCDDDAFLDAANRVVAWYRERSPTLVVVEDAHIVP